MKFDIYTVINEAKDSKTLDLDELTKLFSLANEQVLFNIVAKEDAEKKDDEEKSKIYDFAELVLKNRDNFWTAKRADNLEDFLSEFNKDIKEKIKKDRKKTKRELFDQMNNIAQNMSQTGSDTSETSANAVVFKLFLNEYNTKYAFTWKSFKETKRNYEKGHILEGEDIYVLKALLEKDPKIQKVVDSTVFCKSSHSLSDAVIDKIKEKIG